MAEDWTKARVREDWTRARRQALWEAMYDAVARRPGELLSLEDVRSHLNIRGSRYRGLQHVPLEKIVGSEGRYADFDRRFLPRRSTTAQRWMNIDRAQYEDVNLPPVDLYKIGDIYFVKDGNHRVSVARQRGQIDIDAYVTEYEVDVPLDPSVSMRDFLLTEEYSDFLDWTQLARWRPQQRIELSALGGYLELINHINVHRYYLGIERKGPVSPEEAVTSWFDNVYQPVIEVVRKKNILSYFPGRTEADLYLWIMQHRHYMREAAGVDPGPEVATLDYAAKYGRRSLFGGLSETIYVLGQAASHWLLGTHAPNYPTARSTTARIHPVPSDELLDFVAWMQPERNCPAHEIRLSDDADYPRLRAHIEEHHYQLSIYLQRPATLEEAIQDWCTHFYGPTVEAIREHGLLANRPGRTEADLYMEAVDLLAHRRGSERPVKPSEAVETLQDQTDHDESGFQAIVTNALRLLRRRR